MKILLILALIPIKCRSENIGINTNSHFIQKIMKIQLILALIPINFLADSRGLSTDSYLMLEYNEKRYSYYSCFNIMKNYFK